MCMRATLASSFAASITLRDSLRRSSGVFYALRRCRRGGSVGCSRSCSCDSRACRSQRNGGLRRRNSCTLRRTCPIPVAACCLALFEGATCLLTRISLEAVDGWWPIGLAISLNEATRVGPDSISFLSSTSVGSGVCPGLYSICRGR